MVLVEFKRMLNLDATHFSPPLAAVASLAPESSSRNENTSLPDATQQALRKVVYQGSKKLTSEEIRISMKLFEWDASVFHNGYSLDQFGGLSPSLNCYSTNLDT